MIVDASAILSIVLREEDGSRFSDAINESSERCLMTPVNYLECCLRVDSIGDEERSRRLDEILMVMGVQIEPVGETEARLAREAYRLYGKGRHPARLNLGDCFAYALARSRGERPLFKGDDFGRTDVESAL